MLSLELVRVGEIAEHTGGNDGECTEAGHGGKDASGLLLAALVLDLHLRLNGPDVGLSVLVHRHTSLYWLAVRSVGEEGRRPRGGEGIILRDGEGVGSSDEGDSSDSSKASHDCCVKCVDRDGIPIVAWIKLNLKLQP